MLKQLSNLVGFGQRIMCNGEPQFVICRLPFGENLWVTTDDGAKLPATIKLSVADLARPPEPPTPLREVVDGGESEGAE
jgi:hypothetical protein